MPFKDGKIAIELSCFLHFPGRKMNCWIEPIEAGHYHTEEIGIEILVFQVGQLMLKYQLQFFLFIIQFWQEEDGVQKTSHHGALYQGIMDELDLFLASQ